MARLAPVQSFGRSGEGPDFGAPCAGVQRGTGDVDPFVSVVLTEGNRIEVVGRLAERKHVRAIRKLVVATSRFSD